MKSNRFSKSTYSISHLNDDVCESYDIFLLSRQKVDDLLCSTWTHWRMKYALFVSGITIRLWLFLLHSSYCGGCSIIVAGRAILFESPNSSVIVITHINSEAGTNGIACPPKHGIIFSFAFLMNINKSSVRNSELYLKTKPRRFSFNVYS